MRQGRSGIIVLYKERDWTSFDVVAKARGILSTRKVGHSGTLDPMATGVLPLFLGNATKAVGLLPDTDKEYIATFTLGTVTDTGDITGEVQKRSEVKCGHDEVKDRLSSFTGEITQMPPMYSAVKVNGQPLYKLARQGLEVDRKPRQVLIYSIEDMTGPDEPVNEYKVKVRCSEGTYIRTLVGDLGEKLGCGATLTALERTRACGYTVSDAVTLSQLQEARDNGTIDSLIMPADTAFSHLDRIDLSDELAWRLLNGARSRISKPDGDYRVYHEELFYGIANVTEKKMRQVKLFVSKEEEEKKFKKDD